MNQVPSPRVLVIGLAEATLDLLLPWAAEGRLPNLRRLIESGASGRLRSQAPPITPQLWGTIVTGRSPGHHGAFDFWQRGPDGRFRHINGTDLKAPAVWSLLGERALRCGILNVPFTYPPQKIHGFMISGEDAPGAHPSIAHPPGLYQEITRRFGRYRLKDIFPGGRKKSDYLTLIPDDVGKQTDVMEYLLREKPWEFAMVFYSASAIAQHYFWSDMADDNATNPYRNVIRAAYEALDAAVGRLVDAASRDCRVFVISDCGAGPLQSGVQVNTFLRQAGFLAYRQRKATAASRKVVSRLRTRVQGLLQKWTPKSWYYAVNHHLPGLIAWVQSYLAGSDIDWSATRAFCRGKEGDLFINLRGRDPHGIVEPAEYESVRTAIIERLEALVDPATGQKAVERVYRAEELYKGPMLASAPDLIIHWSGTAYQPTESDRDKDSIFVTRWREYMDWPTSGGHRLEGVLIACGPGIRCGANVTDARIIDLLPTWLRCLGQDVPDELEGRVVTELFERDGHAVDRPGHRQATRAI
ncbi:MAG: alkaline phosphatase family protein [Steroidobacteraceae bacterium]